ncbi:MAG: hypothetical protein U5L96_04060 [Owenweeksia sp.]|nr:hypothetical protein [Owenweeksia sp.]
MDQANTHLAIDNISIQESSSSDLALISIDDDFENLDANTNLLPNASINYAVIGNGGFAHPSKVVFEFKDLCNGGAPIIAGQTELCYFFISYRQ